MGRWGLWLGLEGVKVPTHFSPLRAFSPRSLRADTARLSTPLACLYSGHRKRKPTLQPMTSKKLEVRPPEGPREAWRAWASRSAVVLTRSAFADHLPLFSLCAWQEKRAQVQAPP